MKSIIRSSYFLLNSFLSIQLSKSYLVSSIPNFCRGLKRITIQWIFQVPVKGGRDYITP